MKPPSQFGIEERLPKFKISIQDLKQKNLMANRNLLAMEESTGIGLMLSKRQQEVDKLPRRK